MDAGAVILIVVFIALLWVMTWLWDRTRIDRYISGKGGRLLEKHWNPFGKGWFGEKDSRIYELRYEDAAGNVHEATCKTGLFSGVYFTEDRIVEQARPAEADREKESLLDENRRLREELERVKREKG